ncbi:hypothetical protein Tco_0948978, partial [Tanacetum coccineum]
INEDILNSTTYKTYYAYASGAKEPKKARKFKKPASLKLKSIPVSPKEPTKKPAKKTVHANKSSKSQAGVIIKDTPGVSVSKKKAPTKGKRSKGIEILSDVALSEAALLKEATKISKKDFHISQISGSDEGTGTKPGVPDVPKYQYESDDSDDVSKGDDDKVDNDDGNDAHDSERNDSDDDENPSFTLKDYEEEEHDEEYVQSPEKYESDDDNENMDEEEYDDLYKDVDVKSLREEHEKEGKVVKDAHVTLTSSEKTKGSKQSCSVSSDFASKFLNLDNVPPVINEVASMMNVKVHQEESSIQAPPLPTVPVTAIPKTSTVAATTVSPLI